MRALIDADVLLYEIGYSSQRSPQEVSSWEFCQDLFDRKIALIQDEVGATEPPLLFMTNTVFINHELNKRRRYNDEPIVVYEPNFRIKAAIDKEYKFGRKSEKPFHFQNLVVYALANYECEVAENGLEADDAMCIAQTNAPINTTTICSRDKDVRQCEGWHYSWECGKQASIGPILVDKLGMIELLRPISPTTKKPLTPKIFGYGEKYFYSQLLTGDAVDNVGGLKSKGPVFAYDLLHNAPTVFDCYSRVRAEFEKACRDEWKIKMREQCDLLYMIRSVDNGEIVKWKPPLP